MDSLAWHTAMCQTGGPDSTVRPPSNMTTRTHTRLRDSLWDAGQTGTRPKLSEGGCYAALEADRQQGLQAAEVTVDVGAADDAGTVQHLPRDTLLTAGVDRLLLLQAGLPALPSQATLGAILTARKHCKHAQLQERPRLSRKLLWSLFHTSFGPDLQSLTALLDRQSSRHAGSLPLLKRCQRLRGPAAPDCRSPLLRGCHGLRCFAALHRAPALWLRCCGHKCGGCLASTR